MSDIFKRNKYINRSAGWWHGILTFLTNFLKRDGKSNVKQQVVAGCWSLKQLDGSWASLAALIYCHCSGGYGLNISLLHVCNFTNSKHKR